MPRRQSGQAISLGYNGGEVGRQLLKVELLLVAELDDLTVGVGVRQEGMRLVQERVYRRVVLPSVTLTCVRPETNKPTICLRSAEKSSIFSAKRLSGSVMPDSR